MFHILSYFYFHSVENPSRNFEQIQFYTNLYKGHAYKRHYATIRKVAGSIVDAFGFFS
jgi:hypothetical protein